jgi:hypothetical protein
MKPLRTTSLLLAMLVTALAAPACTTATVGDGPDGELPVEPTPDAAAGDRLLLVLDAEAGSQAGGRVSFGLGSMAPLLFDAISANLDLVEGYAGEVYLLSTPLTVDEASFVSGMQNTSATAGTPVNGYGFVGLTFHDGAPVATEGKHRLRPFLWIESGGDVTIHALMPEVK